MVVAVAMALIVLPAENEMPVGFPAIVVWQVLLSTAAMQALLWIVLGVVFGYLAERVLHPRPDQPAVAMLGRR